MSDIETIELALRRAHIKLINNDEKDDFKRKLLKTQGYAYKLLADELANIARERALDDGRSK